MALRADADAIGLDEAVGLERAIAEIVLVWARAATPDHGRYLKLRRMATANLAKLL